MKEEKKIPIIGICGWKGSGKTTLCVRLIQEFVQRGLKVSSVKHSDHDLHLDSDGTDSARHLEAGTAETVIVGSKQMALFHNLRDDILPDLEKIIGILTPSDLVIIEGFKTAKIPKIETRRLVQIEKETIADKDPYVIAVATDYEISDPTTKVFSLNSITTIANFIDTSIGPLKPRSDLLL